MSPPLPILISGAGISGLALAQGLLRANLPFRLYERDPALNVRSQGYRVRIQGPGITALTQLLPPDLFARLVASCPPITSGAFPTHLDALTGLPTTGMSGAGPPKGQQGGDEMQPLNADRNVLRSVLLHGLEPHIEYGKTFSSYEITAEGITVHFEDGSSAQGSLLVGADGAHSRVRRQFLPQLTYVDTEGRFFYGKTPLTPELEGCFEPRALGGMTLVQDRSKAEIPLSLLLEPIRFKDNEFRAQLPDDYVYWVLVTRTDNFPPSLLAPDDRTLLSLSPPQAAALTQSLTKHWHPSFHPLFALQDVSNTSILRITTARPEILVWEPQERVTLVGDAVHAMSPTAAKGATTALRDAAVLAVVLGEDVKGAEGGFSKEAIGRYEAEMRTYAEEAIRGSLRGGKHLFAMRDFEHLSPVGGRDV